MKKIIIIVFSLLLVIGLVACGNSTQSTMKVEDVPKEAETTTTAEQKQMVVKDADTDSKATEAEQIQSVSLSDTISTDFADIYLDRISIDVEVYPRDTSGVYMYLPAVDGKRFFQLIGVLKNTYSSMYEIDNTLVLFTFDDKYEYSGYLKADKGVFRAFDYQVDPLETVDIHIIGEIPNELIDTFSKCTITFGFKENFARASNLDSCDYKYQLEYTR